MNHDDEIIIILRLGGGRNIYSCRNVDYGTLHRKDAHIKPETQQLWSRVLNSIDTPGVLKSHHKARRCLSDSKKRHKLNSMRTGKRRAAIRRKRKQEYHQQAEKLTKPEPRIHDPAVAPSLEVLSSNLATSPWSPNSWFHKIETSRPQASWPPAVEPQLEASLKSLHACLS